MMYIYLRLEFLQVLRYYTLLKYELRNLDINLDSQSLPVSELQRLLSLYSFKTLYNEHNYQKLPQSASKT